MGNSFSSSLRNAATGIFFAATAAVSEAQDPVNPSAIADIQPQMQPAQLFMSAHTDKTYGEQIDFITDYTPGLTLLTLTKKDLGVDFTEDDKKQLALHSSCTPAQPTKEALDAFKKVEVAGNNLLAMLKNISKANPESFNKDALEAAILEKPGEFSQTLQEVASLALNETAAAMSFSKFFEDKGLKFSIVTMPENRDSKRKEIETLSGIPTEFFSNIQSTPDDFMFMTLAHEIAGHAFNQHGSINHTGYECIEINTNWLDEKLSYESVSDINAAVITRDAQDAKLLSAAPIIKEQEALRAISNFYLTQTNSATYASTMDINYHITTLMFDAKSPTFESGFDVAETPTVSLIQPSISRIADAISGFVVAQKIKAEARINPEKFSNDLLDFVNDLPTTVKGLQTHMNEFSYLGLDTRNGLNGIENHLSYNAESLIFIQKNDLLGKAKSEIDAPYAHIITDLLDDFANAVNTYAPKLRNPAIATALGSALKADDFKFLDYKAFITVVPEEQTAAEIPDNAPQI